MGKRAADALEPRRSQRGCKAPERYRPGLAEVPSCLAAMIHDVAAAAAAKSDVPFDADAVVALEEALEPMLEALCAKAFEHAAKEGRDTIGESEYARAVQRCRPLAVSRRAACRTLTASPLPPALAHSCTRAPAAHSHALSHASQPTRRSLRAVSKSFMAKV